MSDVHAPHAFVLDGQGTTSPQTITTTHADARTPLGAALLLACHQALQRDIAALAPAERAASGLADITTPEALLDAPNHAPHNAAVANTHLFLVQTLRFLAVSRGTPPRVHPLGVLGFSTGMLAGAVLACGAGVPQLLVHATEAFRLAFWMGLRVQQYVLRALRDAPDAAALPWTLVLFGASRGEVQGAVDAFNATQEKERHVYLTAMTNPTCASVSARPDALASFRAHLPRAATTSRLAPIHALYHAPALSTTFSQVLSDITEQHITFPSYADLKHTLRSPVTGQPCAGHQSLAEEIVRATLLEPANFDIVLSSLISPTDRTLFTNIGPGAVLWRSTARLLGGKLEMVDWATPPPEEGKREGVSEPIAVVGMAVRFPGANDVDELWQLLMDGVSTLSPIPEDRFDATKYTTPGRTLRATTGNFISDASSFDASFFKISPREARSMDPQQRVLLHTAYHALESAGFVPHSSATSNPDRVATYVGVATNDYILNLRRDVDVYYSTGTLQAFLAGKLAYAFGLGGPAAVLDTACSSGGVAVQTACRALAARDCDAALAAGVNIISSPDMYLGLDRAHFLGSGQCKPWDASADGYARSEGCGVFVLKRLTDAVREGDRVLGVIRASEVNQSVKAASITQPHQGAQEALFRRLLAAAGVDAASVGVVEAHGTGTKAGDPVEFTSIRSTFSSPHRRPLLLTSIKSNIGHSEAASGCASLAKSLLMLKHGVVPRHISLKTVNPQLIMDGSIEIPTENTKWEGGTRRVVVNNFGAAGSNVALLVEEAPPTPPRSSVAPKHFLLGLSAESAEALEEMRGAYVRRIEGASEQELGDVLYTATARRRRFRLRLAVQGSSKEELLAQLEKAKAVEEKKQGKIVFVFSGQGGQHPGMARTLVNSLPSFRARVEWAEERLRAWGFPGVRGVIEGEEGEVGSWQCAVFVLECALAEVWVRWGVRPDAVVGHSLGEYAALVSAGVLSIEDGLRLVAGRAKLMVELCTPNSSGMLAVRMSPPELERYIISRAEYDALSIACYNSADDAVVAGPLAQLDELQAELKAASTKCARVNVPYAYHTPAMNPLLSSLTSLASNVQLHAPKMPIVSNVHGRVVKPGDSNVFTQEYFAAHCAQPVRFASGVAHLGPVGVLLELGPHPTTLPMLRASGALALPSLKKKEDDWSVLCGALRALYEADVGVDWRRVYEDVVPGARQVDVPAYPFAKTRFWVKYEEDEPAVKEEEKKTTRFSLLGEAAGPTRFETPIAGALAELIEGHRVAGHALCPASVYVEMASAAAQLVLGEGVVALAEFAFASPLVYVRDTPRTVCVEITRAGTTEKHTARFVVESYTTDKAKTQRHCTGSLTLASPSDTAAKLASSAPTAAARHRAVLAAPGNETFRTRTAYELVFARIVSYSATYHTIRRITLDANGIDAAASISLPPRVGAYVADPVFMDTLLHAVGFVVNCRAGANEAYICSEVGKVRVLPELVRADAEYGVYCSVGVDEQGAVGDAYAFEVGESGRVVAVMKRMRFKKLRLSGFAAVLAAATQAGGVPARGAPRIQTVALQPTPAPQAPSRSTSSLVNQVRDVVAAALGVPPRDIADDSDLERLGLDSLTSIEAHHALCTVLGVALPDKIFSTCKTLSDIVAALGPSTSSHHDPAPVSPLLPSPRDSEITLDDTTDADATRASTLLEIQKVLASVLGVAPSDLRSDQDLERLGMDSLMSIEAHHALCAALGTDLPADLFASCKTLRAIQDAVAPEAKGTTSVSFGTETNPFMLQEGGGVPLFLIHDGSGVAHQYSRLGSLGRRVWGIHNPRFTEGGAWEGGVPQMAECYVGLIKAKLEGASECLVGGWSIGGVIAFEVARRLVASGITVPGLVLIDSPHPETSTPLSKAALDAAFSASTPSRAVQLARSSIEHATRALVAFDPSASPASHIALKKAVMLRSREPFEFPEARAESQSDAFLAQRRDPAAIVAGWESILGFPVPVLDIPGNHFEPFSPKYVDEVSERLVEALKMLS